MSYTTKDVDRAVVFDGYSYTYKRYDGEVREIHTKGWHELEEALEYSNARVHLPGVGVATLVETYGGMDQGEERWFVFKVTDADGEERLFRRNGYYASYDGSYFDGPTEEVKSVAKVVNVFEAVA